jgi:hypothetical protein
MSGRLVLDGKGGGEPTEAGSDDNNIKRHDGFWLGKSLQSYHFDAKYLIRLAMAL